MWFGLTTVSPSKYAKFMECGVFKFQLFDCLLFWNLNRTNKFGTVMKVFLFLTLPVPLLLWIPVGVVGSLFTGLGYCFFWPLMATFEAIGEGVPDKFDRCFKVIFFPYSDSSFWMISGVIVWLVEGNGVVVILFRNIPVQDAYPSIGWYLEHYFPESTTIAACIFQEKDIC